MTIFKTTGLFLKLGDLWGLFLIFTDFSKWSKRVAQDITISWLQNNRNNIDGYLDVLFPRVSNVFVVFQWEVITGV